jgi:hypothetical protein
MIGRLPIPAPALVAMLCLFRLEQIVRPHFLLKLCRLGFILDAGRHMLPSLNQIIDSALLLSSKTVMGDETISCYFRGDNYEEELLLFIKECPNN